jgi:hypothetical protein
MRGMTRHREWAWPAALDLQAVRRTLTLRGMPAEKFAWEAALDVTAEYQEANFGFAAARQAEHARFFTRVYRSDASARCGDPHASLLRGVAVGKRLARGGLEGQAS